jgi:preprotein translocase subunit SecD
MQKNAGLVAIFAILVAVAAFFVFPPGQKTKLGLDLQGGLAVILEAQDSQRTPRTEDGMKQAISIIDKRVNGLGFVEPEIQRQGQWKVSVQLPGIKDPQTALNIIGKTAVLEFYDTNQFGTAYASQDEALKAAGVATVDALPATSRVIQWPVGVNGATTDRYYLVTTDPVLTGTDLSSAKQGFDQNNQPKVDMEFNSDGAKKFSDITSKMAQAAQVTGQDQLLAIVLDGRLESAPRVQEQISGGKAEITGKFTLAEAQQLALVLQTGALPVELKVVSQSTIGAVLGKASLRQALLAGGVGLLLVLIFMIAFYRLLGLIADIALLCYGVLFWGILNAIGVTLTLPGIAGALITLGMAVDANVLIFSRIREEVAGGKTLRTAFDAGTKRALRSVLDANVTTMLTAAVLFWAAAGGVRGFALTLGIGVILSLFTAVVLVQAMLNVLAGTSLFRNVSLLGLKTSADRALVRQAAAPAPVAATPAPSTQKLGKMPQPKGKKKKATSEKAK